MSDLFINLLNMSITASWLVLAVIVLRFLLKKAPKWINAVLWSFVGFRLVCPFSFESVLSLIPSAETVPTDIVYSQSPTIHSGIPVLNSTVNPIISESFAPDVTASANPLQIVTAIASAVWITGIAAMILYAVISFVRLHKKVCEGVVLKDNIWLCDRIDTPFILGVFRPRIFIPSGMAESDMEYVIAHENAHLKRRDHWWKPLGFILLTVYWFNPVMWVAYILLCRDIELACDEKVLKEMGADIKKLYSEALINCSVSRRTISACPLAFGETGVKGRIKSVLSYKKPALWIIIIAVISCIVVAVCFLTNPKSDLKDSNPELDAAVSQAILEINSSGEHYNTECVAEGHIIYGYEEEGDNVTVYLQEEFAGFGFKNGYFMKQTGHTIPSVYTFIKNDDVYVLSDYDYPMDGEKYYDSIKEMFPSEYVYRAFNVSEKDYADLWAQCVSYAEDYLIRIGRDAEVRDYSEVPHTMLTDVGVSVEVSNKIVENRSFNKYDSDIGNYEVLDGGIRYIYRTDYDKDRGVIIYTTEVYKTGDIIEKFEIDGQTGELLLKENNDVVLPEPENHIEKIYYYPERLNYAVAAQTVKEMSDKYAITAIHYPASGEVESGILIGEAYCNEVGNLLEHVKWKRSLPPIEDLSSPGSVEFVIEEDYRVTVYKRKSGSLFAYAVVKYGEEERYYHASYGDYKEAVAILHPPENIAEAPAVWTYSPQLSATWHSFFAVELGIDVDYTHTVTSCRGGEMVNLDADGQPHGTSMKFENGETIYWTPDESVFNKENYDAEIHFTLYDGDVQLYYGSLLLTCVERTTTATFEVYLQDSSGLVLRQGTNGVYIEKEAIGSLAPVGGYDEYLYSSEHDSAYISLSHSTREAFFSLSALSNYVCNGTYTEDDIYIVITDNDMKHQYTFKKGGNCLYFVAEKSSEVPEYKYETDGKPVPCVPDGAVFESYGYSVGYIDKTYADIDNDGIKEDCVLGYGPTSGLFTVTFYAYENGELEYCNTFNSEIQELSFGWDEKGKTVIRGSEFRSGKDPLEKVYDVIVEDGNIVLKSGNKMMPYWGEQGLSSPYAGS